MPLSTCYLDRNMDIAKRIHWCITFFHPVTLLFTDSEEIEVSFLKKHAAASPVVMKNCNS